ncbi:hypothetical protein [Aliamphritea spongicola]|nr:hypothetical protein [Aliamphritea spongicola]
MKLSSTLDEFIENESWGIDNLSVQELDAQGRPLILSVQEGVFGASVATLAMLDPDSADAVATQ